MQTPRFQNVLLLLASYAVYAYLDARMLWLLVAATLVTFAVGWGTQRLQARGAERAAGILTTAGVILAVGLLVAFKYFDFFARGIVASMQSMGLNVSWTALHLVLPVGLSFYSFKLISYMVEVHRERIPVERDFVAFAAYVAFFPTILAGPIDRPQHFLPQLHQSRALRWENLVSGAKMILWGAFMKICVADILSPVTDMAWDAGGERLALWAFLMYPVQMYADFSGYSLMAIGVAKTLDFDVACNFRQPFMARNVAEYWRRWHMSLTTWVTDYVFMPLSLRWRDAGRWGLAAAVMVNLVVIGMWHGDSITYLLFGLYHAMLFMPLVFGGTFGRNKKLRTARWGLPAATESLKMARTYLLVAVGFVIFRAPNAEAVWAFLCRLFTPALPMLPAPGGSRWFYLVVIFGALLTEYYMRNAPSPLHFKGNGLMHRRWARWAVYYVLLALLYVCADTGTATQFIYTQF